MGSAHHYRAFVSCRLLLQGAFQRVEFFLDDAHGFFELQGVGGVHYVVACGAEVNVGAAGAANFRERANQGGEVVFYFLLDGFHSGYFHVLQGSHLGDFFRVFPRDVADFRVRQSQRSLNVEEFLNAVFFLEDPAHLSGSVSACVYG